MLHPSYAELIQALNSDVVEGDQPVVNSRYSVVLATRSDYTVHWLVLLIPAFVLVVHVYVLLPFYAAIFVVADRNVFSISCIDR